LREQETKFGTISRQSDLSQYITDIYTHLYSSDAHALGIVEAQEQCWANVPVRVTNETNAFLTRNFTLKEIHDAIRTLPKGKAPGHDGVPMEFFQECANEVAPMLLKAFTTMLSFGEASAYINKGLITLIPKSGDHSKLNNWRPITLLGSTYKVLAKMVIGRIQAFLPHITRPNQMRFMEGRSILDNTFMAQESLDWAVESNQDLVLLLLDFEKAFDMIEWGFLFTALSKLGFNDIWVSWVRAFYHLTSFDALLSSLLNPFEGPSVLNCGNVELGSAPDFQH
jgi:hypothetical protein